MRLLQALYIGDVQLTRRKPIPMVRGGFERETEKKKKEGLPFHNIKSPLTGWSQ